MTSIVILAVISALGIGCLLVCLYGLHQAGKEQPVRRVLITRIIEVEQTLPKHQFGDALLSPAGERPTLSARVLQFPVPAVWGSDHGGEQEYLRVFVNRLRKKIERNPANPKYLLTEPWVGYRLRVPEVIPGFMECSRIVYASFMPGVLSLEHRGRSE